MTHRMFIFVATFAGVLIPSVSVADGELDQLRGSVDRPSSGPPSRRGHNEDDWQQDHCHDHGFWDAVFGPPLTFALTSPWWGPHSALQDHFGIQAEFPRHPYEGNLPGSLVIFSEPPGRTKSWGGQFTAEYGNDFDGIEQIGGRYLIEGSHRFGVDTEFHSWLEELPQGTDSLWTGDFNVVHRFAQSEHVQFRTGLGANWLEDHGSADFGINFTYGVDVFPKKPWVWSNTIDLGTLGDAGRFHFRSTIGLQVRNVEFFTGYDYQRIGDAELPGLLTGIKLSF